MHPGQCRRHYSETCVLRCTHSGVRTSLFRSGSLRRCFMLKVRMPLGGGSKTLPVLLSTSRPKRSLASPCLANAHRCQPNAHFELSTRLHPSPITRAWAVVYACEKMSTVECTGSDSPACNPVQSCAPRPSSSPSPLAPIQTSRTASRSGTRIQGSCMQ